jgi:hypothetical protein
VLLSGVGCFADRYRSLDGPRNILNRDSYSCYDWSMFVEGRVRYDEHGYAIMNKPIPERLLV